MSRAERASETISWERRFARISPGVLTLESLGAVTAAPKKGLQYTSHKTGLPQKAYWSVIHETNNSNLALLLS